MTKFQSFTEENSSRCVNRLNSWAAVKDERLRKISLKKMPWMFIWNGSDCMHMMDFLVFIIVCGERSKIKGWHRKLAGRHDESTICEKSCSLIDDVQEISPIHSELTKHTEIETYLSWLSNGKFFVAIASGLVCWGVEKFTINIYLYLKSKSLTIQKAFPEKLSKFSKAPHSPNNTEKSKSVQLKGHKEFAKENLAKCFVNLTFPANFAAGLFWAESFAPSFVYAGDGSQRTWATCEQNLRETSAKLGGSFAYSPNRKA